MLFKNTNLLKTFPKEVCKLNDTIKIERFDKWANSNVYWFNLKEDSFEETSFIKPMKNCACVITFKVKTTITSQVTIWGSLYGIVCSRERLDIVYKYLKQNPSYRIEGLGVIKPNDYFNFETLLNKKELGLFLH